MERKRCARCSMPDVDGTLWLLDGALWCGSCLRGEVERLRGALGKLSIPEPINVNAPCYYCEGAPRHVAGCPCAALSTPATAPTTDRPTPGQREPCSHGLVFESCAPCLAAQLAWERDGIQAYCDSENAMRAERDAARKERDEARAELKKLKWCDKHAVMQPCQHCPDERIVKTLEKETTLRSNMQLERDAARAEAARYREALVKAEAALADIGDSEGPDRHGVLVDRLWHERRAREVLPLVRAALGSTGGSAT